MWFKVYFYRASPPILAGVGSDGEIYFKASDVGNFLRYSNIYAFASRHATKDFNSFLPLEIRPISRKIAVFTFNEMMYAIHQFKDKHKIPVCVHEMVNLWWNGCVDTPMPKNTILNFRYAPKLYLYKEKTIPVQTWIQCYKDVSLKFYKSISKNEDASNNDDDFYYSRPPPSVKNVQPCHEDDDESLKSQSTDSIDQNIIQAMKEMDNEFLLDPTTTMEPPEDSQTSKPDDDQNPQNIEIENFKTMNNSCTMDKKTVEILSKNGDLIMDFDAFPPNQIYIRMHDIIYKYIGHNE